MKKKRLLVMAMMLALAVVWGGCATRGDLEEMQAQEKAIGAKADQSGSGCTGSQSRRR